MLYIAADIEDIQREFANMNRLSYFSEEGFAAILEWYDEQGIDQELDVIEICGEWEEYDDAADIWYYYRAKAKMPKDYDPEQFEALTDAMAADGLEVMQLENGNWLVKE